MVFVPCCLARATKRGKAEPVPAAWPLLFQVSWQGRVTGKLSLCAGAETLPGLMSAYQGKCLEVLCGLLSHTVLSIRLF